VTAPWQAQREALGAFIRTQRKMANLSLRQLAELTHGRSVLTAAPPATADVPGRHRAARVSCYAANAGGRRAA
jgi:hypothetical protein